MAAATATAAPTVPEGDLLLEVRTLERQALFAARFGAVSAILLGVVGVAWTSLPLLGAFQGLMPDDVVLRLATATGFTIGGAALLLRTFHGPVSQRAGQVLAVVLALLGALSLAEYLSTPIGQGGAFRPVTAASFTLVGSAMAALDLRRRRDMAPTDVLALAAGLAAVFVLNAHATVRVVPESAGMALGTAIGILALVAGTILARTHGGLGAWVTRPGSAGELTRRLLPPIAFLLVGGVVLRVLRITSLPGATFGEAILLTAGVTFLLLVAAANIRRVRELETDRNRMFAELLARKEADRAAALHQVEANEVVLQELAEHARALEREREETYEPRMLALWQDMTDARKRVERGERFLQEVMDKAGNPIFVKDREGRYLAVNEAGARVLGRPREVVLGSRVTDLLPRETAERLIADDRTVITTGKPHQGEVDLVVEGERRTLLVSRTPLRDETGAVTGVLAVAQDVTSIRQTREALRQSNEDLARFATIAAHDLREPLRKIRTFGSVLMDVHGDGLGTEGRGVAQRMVDAAARLDLLVEDLLRFSSIKTSARPFRRVDVREVLDQVIEDLDVAIRETDAEVVVGDLPVIDGDATQLYQMLRNLVENALKYRRPGVRPRVEVETRHVDGFVRLKVRDNGIGFEPRHASRIFEPFERLHDRGAYPGTGMGLAIVAKIVERHRGAVTAQGRPGEGATFTVTLPVRQSRRVEVRPS